MGYNNPIRGTFYINPFESNVAKDERLKQEHERLGFVEYYRGTYRGEFLTDLQKTAIAAWRDVADLEYPFASEIDLEILRRLRKHD